MIDDTDAGGSLRRCVNHLAGGRRRLNHRRVSPALEDLFSFLRFASISTDSSHAKDVQDCAGWLCAKLQGMGLSAEIHSTPRHPVVVARNRHIAGRRTVMIYGHYDVQPVDPLELWQSDPFQPVIRDGRIWARGATDNKGQMLAHVLGVERILRTQGELPVNLILLFEGEEEIGSPNLAPFLTENRDALRCDVIAISDTGMVAPGVPTFGYGLRGIACCEVTLRGPAGDLHSGLFGGAVANPAAAIARLAYSLPSAMVKASSCTAVAPASCMWYPEIEMLLNFGMLAEVYAIMSEIIRIEGSGG